MMSKQSEDDDRTETSMACCWNPLSFEHRYSQRIQISPVTQQLNEMSPEERQHVTEDIHGVANRRKESQEFIQEHLELFEVEIGKVKGEERRTYDLAVSMDPLYVQKKEFRLKFLRADEFDVKNATTRIMIHFKYKLELFGLDKLVKDITFDDLSNDVQGLVYTGVHQFLRDKDAQGRTILLNCPEFNISSTCENSARARWYQYMVATEEESTQRYGIVVVAMWNELAIFDVGNIKALGLIRRACPAKLAAVHHCVVNYRWLSTQLLPVLDMLGKTFQTRLRSHVEDSTIHCLYTLQSFGINPKSLPLESNGRFHIKWFLECLEKRKDFERRQSHGKTINMPTIANKSGTGYSGIRIDDDSSNVSIIVPTDVDVILGRGVKVSGFSGNTKLGKMIALEAASYQKAPTSFDKTCITLNTYRRIQESGGRFLKKKKINKSFEWVVVDDDEARKSVSDRFRNKLRR